jgi:hypothetical protein
MLLAAHITHNPLSPVPMHHGIPMGAAPVPLGGSGASHQPLPPMPQSMGINSLMPPLPPLPTMSFPTNNAIGSTHMSNGMAGTMSSSMTHSLSANALGSLAHDPLGALLASEPPRARSSLAHSSLAHERAAGPWETRWGGAASRPMSAPFNGSSLGSAAPPRLPSNGLDGFEDSFEDAALMRDLASLLRDEPDNIIAGGAAKTPPAALGGLHF